MNRILFLIFLLQCFFSCDLFAQTISIAEAMDKARSLRSLSNSNSSKGNRQCNVAGLQLSYTAKSSSTFDVIGHAVEERALFYVFNYSDGGFAIIGADKKAREVLGFSDNGTFDIDSIPSDMKWWLSQYSQQIETALDKGESPVAAISTDERQDVEVMMTTNWNQYPYYNNALPAAYSECPVGCVATAMSQVMRYYSHPTKGTGSYNYTRSGTSFSAKFSNTTYDYDNMPTSLDASSTAEQIAAVSTLMYHTGVSVHTNYSSSGSDAGLCSVARALRSYFSYDSGLQYISHEAFGDSIWESMIYNEMASRRPVLYGGQDTSGNGGHCFVLDGYKASDNTYHINWGWGGAYDGYFALSGTTALHGASYYFSNNQEAVIGVQKPVAGSEPTNAFLVTGGYDFSPSNVEDGRNLTITCNTYNLCNLGYEYDTCDIGLLLVNKATRESYANKAASINMAKMTFKSNKFSTYETYSISCTFTDLPVGTYYVQPAYQLNGCTLWHSMAEKDDAVLTVADNIDEDSKRCDANGDGVVDIDDVTYIINYILKKK